MSTRRGFLGKLLGLAAAPLAKKVEVQANHADSGFLGPGGKLIDDGTLLQPIHNVARYARPQNVGAIAEDGVFPFIAPRSVAYLAQVPTFAIYNPTSHGLIVDIGGESQRVHDVERAHDLAIQEDRARDLYKKNLQHDDWLYPVDPEEEV